MPPKNIFTPQWAYPPDTPLTRAAAKQCLVKSVSKGLIPNIAAACLAERGEQKKAHSDAIKLK